MIGEVIFRSELPNNSYHETVILEEGTVQLILCSSDTQFHLYRLCTHGTDLDGSGYWTPDDAIAAYQYAVSIMRTSKALT